MGCGASRRPSIKENPPAEAVSVLANPSPDQHHIVRDVDDPKGCGDSIIQEHVPPPPPPPHVEPAVTPRHSIQSQARDHIVHHGATYPETEKDKSSIELTALRSSSHKEEEHDHDASLFDGTSTTTSPAEGPDESNDRQNSLIGDSSKGEVADPGTMQYPFGDNVFFTPCHAESLARSPIIRNLQRQMHFIPQTGPTS